ncbi:hypothetical protein I6F53_18850 [Pseudoalteromonas sp. SWN29]|uniref:hypothetical protein n=1 Tax=Pseudoalteromonas sp. SWN29 TaxID=2792064 RepID=UPI0018CD29EB|nr:hypothetical protein [Pseudoalteromonas sp. SWN29]MBH0029025.1 hypothetical protein [Pseudoalteromonas sp. SWN29]
MDKIILTSLAAALTIMLSGCASKAPQSQDVIISTPLLNKISDTISGAKLLSQATGTYTETVTVEPFDAYYGGVPNRTVFYKSTGVNFESNNDSAVSINNSLGEPLRSQNYVQYNPEKDEICIDLMICYDSSIVSFTYSREKTLMIRKDSLQQIIEYNGKVGRILRFTYREFSDSMTQKPFSKDFTIDLGENDDFVFKGAKIKVLEASKNSIKYKVLSNFDNTLIAE